MNDWNKSIIEEFRSNRGKVGGVFAGAPLLLLYTSGAKTGKERVNPVMYQAVDGNFAIFGSKGGAPTNPDWYHNLVANPGVKIEVGDESFEVTARVTSGEERERIWSLQKERYPTFAAYEQRTRRQIPVVVLERTE